MEEGELGEKQKTSKKNKFRSIDTKIINKYAMVDVEQLGKGYKNMWKGKKDDCPLDFSQTPQTSLAHPAVKRKYKGTGPVCNEYSDIRIFLNEYIHSTNIRWIFRQQIYSDIHSLDIKANEYIQTDRQGNWALSQYLDEMT